MEDISIKKAKLNNKGGVDITYIDFNGNERVLKGTHEISNTLAGSFLSLAPYHASLTEQKEAEYIDWQVKDTYSIPSRVTGVTRQVGDTEKVQLLGKRTLKSGVDIEINSPLLDMDTLSYEWSHANELDKDLANLYEGLKEYIREAE